MSPFLLVFVFFLNFETSRGLIAHGYLSCINMKRKQAWRTGILGISRSKREESPRRRTCPRRYQTMFLIFGEFWSLSDFHGLINGFCRNMYDWISISLLLACIGTHLEDIRSHSEFKARLHIRIMSVTVIFISVRLFKSSRILNKRFGTLVMILYYSIYDMFIWFVLYLVIWLSFSESRLGSSVHSNKHIFFIKAVHFG